ncbi:hypothetical protein HO675_06850 [Streptococcus suis]|nr:hypothetical protein [Streptococcus suis]
MKKENSKELKYIDNRRMELEARLSALRNQRGYLGKEIAKLAADLNSLSQRADSLRKRSGLIVSEEALLAYLEKIEKINLEAPIRQITEDEKLLEQVKMLGNGTYPVSSGAFRVVVKDNIVVNILLNESDS